jgi:hypothetical protein
MRSWIIRLVLAIASTSFLMALAQYVFRGFWIYIRFCLHGRVAGLEAIRKKHGERIRFYVVRDIWVCNGIACPGVNPEDEELWPPEMMKMGVMVNRLRVTTELLQREFPDADVRKTTLSYFH